MTLYLNELLPAERQDYLQHIIAPRPIALASTIDEEGNANLSPFSFFNLFSADPPIVIFSPARRIRDNSTKHTLHNVYKTPEVAISVVTYDIVHQASLASSDYPKGTDEFVKAGFTKKKSLMIAPAMVAEARVSFECKVNDVKSLGDKGGSGQLVIAEILCIHIDDSLLSPSGKVMQEKLELVARMGGDWYAHVTPAALFKVPKPSRKTGIGIDQLPRCIRYSDVLTGNQLAQLANVEHIPVREEHFQDERFNAIRTYFKSENGQLRRLHIYAQELIEEGNIEKAWQVLLG